MAVLPFVLAAVTLREAFDTALLGFVGSAAGGAGVAVAWLGRWGVRVEHRLKAIENLLHPNGGSSLVDRVEAICSVMGLPPAPPRPDSGLRRRSTDREEM